MSKHNLLFSLFFRLKCCRDSLRLSSPRLPSYRPYSPWLSFEAAVLYRAEVMAPVFNMSLVRRSRSVIKVQFLIIELVFKSPELFLVSRSSRRRLLTALPLAIVSVALWRCICWNRHHVQSAFQGCACIHVRVMCRPQLLMLWSRLKAVFFFLSLLF